jgi:hypothetical protein
VFDEPDVYLTHETSTKSDDFEDDPFEQSTVASSGTPTTHNTTPVPSSGNISSSFVVITSAYRLLMFK